MGGGRGGGGSIDEAESHIYHRFRLAWSRGLVVFVVESVIAATQTSWQRFVSVR